MGKHGPFTAESGAFLKKQLKDQQLEVDYDHGNRAEGSGTIVSSLDVGPSRPKSLSQLDIAIYRHIGNSRAAVVLIELEESKLTPKVLLGDIFGTLLGRSITSKRVPLRVGRWTTLIVAGLAGGTHVQRSTYLAKHAGTHRGTKRTGNAALGGIEVIDLSRAVDPKRALLAAIQPFIDKGLAILEAK